MENNRHIGSRARRPSQWNQRLLSFNKSVEAIVRMIVYAGGHCGAIIYSLVSVLGPVIVVRPSEGHTVVPGWAQKHNVLTTFMQRCKLHTQDWLLWLWIFALVRMRVCQRVTSVCCGSSWPYRVTANLQSACGVISRVICHSPSGSCSHTFIDDCQTTAQVNCNQNAIMRPCWRDYILIFKWLF